MDGRAVTFPVGFKTAFCFVNRPELDISANPDILWTRELTSHALHSLQCLSAEPEAVLSENSRLVQSPIQSLQLLVLQDAV